ncbi:anion permease [Actinomadura sp. 6N118]|uniref:anion permease n=1 Tax=Actinomadura sp. 6N118 TaxID=3375151 RepID=UPI0037917F99
MEHVTFLVVVVIITALVFDFTNGFHDTANAMATSIATGALKPKVAVAISGALNLVGAFLSVEVAKTISGGIVDDSLVTPAMVFAGLMGAILWNLVTWFLGLPSSSSHGTNDAQKTMGVITLTLISAGALSSASEPPLWVVASAGLAIAIGTYLGGWRIIRTLGTGLMEIQSPQGFAAETSATTVILASSHMGFALSTTQVASGSIMGAGLGRRLSQVRWSVAGRMALAWLLTLPAAAAVGGVAAAVTTTGTAGVVLAGLVGLACAIGIYAASRRAPVHAGNVNTLPEPARAGA